MPDTTRSADDIDTIDDAETSHRAGRMETALASARSAANSALDETRRVARRAGEAAEANPLAIVAGGIAIGVAAGAFLPRTQRENELLGPVGRRLTAAATDAATAARDAAKIELATLPLSKEAARAQVGKVLDQVAKAVTDAGEAALSSRRPPASQAVDIGVSEDEPSAPSRKRSK